MKYLIFQGEIGVKKRRHHWQGFVITTRSVRRSAIIKLLDLGKECKLLPMWSTPLCCSDYCRPDYPQPKAGNKTKAETGLFAPTEEFGELPNLEPKVKAKDFIQAIKQGKTILELANEFPGFYLQHRSKLQTLINDLAPPKNPPQFPSGYNIPFDSLEKALVLYGISGSGKSAFANAHFKNPKEIFQIDDLKDFNSNHHDGIVFQDMSFKHTNFSQILNVVQTTSDSTVHCRHTNAHIPRGTKRIFTYNEDDLFDAPMSSEQARAIKRRINFLEVDKPLFDAPPDN